VDALAPIIFLIRGGIMPSGMERRTEKRQVITVSEAAFVAGVSLKTVNQAIDRNQIRVRELRRSTDRARRGIEASDAAYLAMREVLAPRLWPRLYRFLHGRRLSELPTEFRIDTIVLNYDRLLEEVQGRLRILDRIEERVESDPEVRGGEPVFRATRTPVYAIARKIALGSTREELHEDYPQLKEGDLELATQYSKLYPPRGRPRTERVLKSKHGRAGERT
jgi:uncharacterized protein (DUF433 family)